MNPVTNLETLIQTNHSIQEAIFECGGRDELEKAIENESPHFFQKLEEKGVFKKKESLFENLIRLSNTLEMYETAFRKDERKISAKKLLALHLLAKNLHHITTCASKISHKVPETEEEAKKAENYEIAKRKFQHVLSYCKTMYVNPKHMKKTEGSNSVYYDKTAITPFFSFYKDTLGLEDEEIDIPKTLNSQIANKIQIFVTQFENELIPSKKGLKEKIISFFIPEKKEKQHLSESHWLLYSAAKEIAQQLKDKSLEIRFLHHKELFFEIMFSIGMLLVEAKIIQISQERKPNVPIQRGPLLLALRELLRKVRAFSDTHGNFRKEAKKLIGELEREIGINENGFFSLDTLTSDELEHAKKTAQSVVETLEKFITEHEGSTSWMNRPLVDDPYSKSWQHLMVEMTSSKAS